MSISTLPEFENVCIGDNEETIRKMIVIEEPGKSSEYSINAVIPLINKNMQEGWSTTAFVSENRPTVYAIVVGGILYYISTAHHKSSLPQELLLNESGRWIIPLVDFQSIQFLKEYVDRYFNE